VQAQFFLALGFGMLSIVALTRLGISPHSIKICESDIATPTRNVESSGIVDL